MILEVENEIWATIPDHPNHQVSNRGNIRSMDHKSGRKTVKGKIRKLVVGPLGYCRVQLLNRGTIFSVHRIVAEVFIPNPENKQEVNHKNGIKTDNRVENLEWATRSENTIHARSNNLLPSQRGVPKGPSKLTKEDVHDIKWLLVLGATGYRIAKEYGVRHSVISAIKVGKSWKHVSL